MKFGLTLKIMIKLWYYLKGKEIEIEIENPNTIEMLLIAIRRPTESWGPGQIWNWPQLSS